MKSIQNVIDAIILYHTVTANVLFVANETSVNVRFLMQRLVANSLFNY